MHVIHCLTHSGIGGGQSATFALIQQVRHEHPELRITVVLPPNGIYVDAFRSLPVPVVEFPFDTLRAGSLLSAQGMLRSLRPDIVHSHGKGAGLYARLAPSSTKHMRHVHTYHGFIPPASPVAAALYHQLDAMLVKKTDAIVAVSKSESDLIRAAYHLGAEKVFTIPNVVDCGETARRAEGALPAFTENFFKTNSDAFVLTMIARNDAIKNHRLACDTAEVLLRNGGKFAFIFIGPGDELDFLLALRNKYPARVLLLGTTASTAAILKRCHAMLLTSKMEGGLPLVIQEAFCLGKPSIGTNVPGIRDIIIDGVNGALCDERPEAFAESITRIASDVPLYQSMERNACEWATGLNLRAWANRYHELYTSLCA